MKLVGEAVAEELHEYDTNLTVLGIATWGVIKDKELLINPVYPIFTCIIKILNINKNLFSFRKMIQTI
jgi:hypothetical protein